MGAVLPRDPLFRELSYGNGICDGNRSCMVLFGFLGEGELLL